MRTEKRTAAQGRILKDFYVALGPRGVGGKEEKTGGGRREGMSKSEQWGTACFRVGASDAEQRVHPRERTLTRTRGLFFFSFAFHFESFGGGCTTRRVCLCVFVCLCVSLQRGY